MFADDRKDKSIAPAKLNVTLLQRKSQTTIRESRVKFNMCEDSFCPLDKRLDYPAIESSDAAANLKQKSVRRPMRTKSAIFLAPLLSSIFMCGSVESFSWNASPSSPTTYRRHRSIWHDRGYRRSSVSLFMSTPKSTRATTKVTEPNSRYIATKALMESTKKKKAEFSLRRLDKDKDLNNLEMRDRRFARALVSTVERRKGQIDSILNHCMDTKAKKTSRPEDAMVQAALRLGVAQLLFLEVPAHASLKETIDVLRMDPHIRVSEPRIKFANAVLRRVQREGKDLLETIASPYDNIAPWLLVEWRKSWGEEKLAAIANAAMTESPVYLSVNHPVESSSEERIQKLNSLQQSFEQRAIDLALELDGGDTGHTLEKGTEILAQGTIFVEKSQFPGAVSKWPLYDNGDWWVQDVSATLPAIALYNSLLKDSSHANNEMSIVDLCAAPGGKTAQLLSLGFPEVTAVELSARRARQLQSNMERLQLQDRCTVTVGDGSQWIPPEGPETVAGVLLDVPCTATGTASRRPDVLRRDDNLDEILATQYNLATHCVDNVLAPGGIIVYATCSLLRQESEDQVQKLLSRKEGANLKSIPFTEGEIPGFDEAIDDSGNLRVIPGWLPGKLNTCDGFFVARLQKQ